MPDSGKKLLLVGCGKMGAALLRGIVGANLMAAITVVEPTPPAELTSLQHVTWIGRPELLDQSFVPDVILIAVKPQMIADVLPAYAHFTQSLFLSIAAGTTLAALQNILKNPHAAIIRTMPNLPASIGQGMTVAIANDNVDAAQRALGDAIMRAVGAVAWIEDEAQMDAVTALSGSGPAYVFALCEAMERAGVELGLSQEMALLLARQTVIGSGALLAAVHESAGDLRRAVTSPKGTTEAALTHLLGPNGLFELVGKAMSAAAARSKELAK